MSTLAETSVLDRSAPSSASFPAAGREAAAVDVHYTICPVFVASNVALELGWIEEEVRRVGGRLNYLFSSAEEKCFLPHFSHQHANLFRDGGNIPAIWAKAERSDTTLVALTWSRQGGHLLARADSGIHRVADLSGRRVAVYKSGNTDKVDWWRATSHRGITLALGLAGLDVSDVQLVNVTDEGDHAWGGGQRPADVWASRSSARRLGVEPQALRAGAADAFFTSQGRALSLVASGEFTIIEDLGRHPDWTLQVNNSPYTLAVNTELAQQRPEIVTAYLRAVVRAGRWINSNRAAAASILHRTTFYPSVEAVAAAIAHTDFVPDLSPRNLAAIDVTRKFLKQHGYIQRDFNAADWADGRFLAEALRTL